MRARVVTWHAGNAVAWEHGDRSGAGSRRGAEPFLVQLRDGAVYLQAFDGDIERLAQFSGILGQRSGPDQPGRIEIR